MTAVAEEVIRRAECAKNERALWHNNWNEVADLVRPDYSFTAIRTAGQPNRRMIYDSTAPNAQANLSAYLDGSLTNTSIRWMEFVPIDPSIDLDTDEEALNWLYAASSICMRHLEHTSSGFSQATTECWLDLTSWGTACVMRVSDISELPRWAAKPLMSVALEGDEDTNEVVATHREFCMKGWRCEKKWSDLPEKLRSELKREGGLDKDFKFLHSIYERFDRDPAKVDAQNKQWASVYVCLDTKEVVKEGGFDENPMLTPRWSVAAGEVYGRSPAMAVMPDIKTINALSKITLQGIELGVRPPMLVAANGIDGSLATTPGSIIYYKAGTRELPQALDTKVNVRDGEFQLERLTKSINAAFYNDKFNLPEIDRMTREEVVTRRQLSLLVASPILARIYAELLNPMVSLTFRALVRAGMIKPPPRSLRGQPLVVAYSSPLAASRGGAQLEATGQFVAAIAPMMQTSPEIAAQIIRRVDIDKMVSILARAAKLDPKALRSTAEVEEMKQQQERMASTAMAAQTAVDASTALKNVSQARQGLLGAA